MLRAFALGLLLLAGCATTPDAGTVICTPGERRCLDTGMKQKSAQRCNETGTQWVVVATCVNCVDGVSCDLPAHNY